MVRIMIEKKSKTVAEVEIFDRGVETDERKEWSSPRIYSLDAKDTEGKLPNVTETTFNTFGPS